MSTSEEPAVRATVERYLEGLKKADVALVKSAFHDHAALFGPFGDELIASPISMLYEWIDSELEPGQTGAAHRIEYRDVEIAGPVALVRCWERDFMGTDTREFFTLVKEDGNWKITSKSWAE